MALRFRIYYGDGSTYTGNPFLAPATNVQVVVTATNEGTAVRHGEDYYVWNAIAEQWFAADEAGFWDYLMEYEGPKAIIFGRNMPRDDKFWEVVQRARREGLG